MLRNWESCESSFNIRWFILFEKEEIFFDSRLLGLMNLLFSFWEVSCLKIPPSTLFLQLGLAFTCKLCFPSFSLALRFELMLSRLFFPVDTDFWFSPILCSLVETEIEPIKHLPSFLECEPKAPLFILSLSTSLFSFFLLDELKLFLSSPCSLFSKDW